MNNKRTNNEIAHSKIIAEDNPEKIWGWNTEAGKLRAKRRAQLIAQSAHLRQGLYVLEIGCGTGVYTEKFAETGARIVAVDISRELLELARAKDLPAERVQFLEMKFEDCNQIGPFDAIIGSSVLHHLEINKALSNIYKLLKPDGLLSFAEPNMLNPQIAIQKNVSWVKKRMGDSPDETAFLSWEMHRLLRNAGFTEIKITPFDWLHPATPVKYIAAVERIGLYFEKIPLLRNFAGSLHIYGRRPREGKCFSCR